MLSRIDRYLIRQQERSYNKPFRKFGASNLGSMLTTLVVLKVTVDEIIEKREEGQILLSNIFIVIGALIILYSIRKVFLKKNIDRFEYRLKIAEALIILYMGIEKWMHIAAHVEADNYRVYTFPFIILVLFALYLVQARIIFLKYIGKIHHQ